MAKFKMLASDYHRNGIAGLGFVVTLFQDDDGTRKVAIDFGVEADKATGSVVCAVLDVDLLAAGDVAFGSNSWRGDNYAAKLRAAPEV